MTRRVAVACTCACVVLLTARSVQAQHAPAKPAAPPAEAQAHPPAVAAAPAKPPETHGAPAATPAAHGAPVPAKDAKDAHAAPKAAAPAPAAPKSPSIASAVERIQQRMAEVSTPAPGRGRAAGGAASSVAVPKPRRIYLDWRAPLVWPAELVGEADTRPLSHITLTWSIK